MKKILLSVRPKYCELIFNGKKTIEVRRTRPKLEPPFEVLVYCTMPKERWSVGHQIFHNDTLYTLPTGELKTGDALELRADWLGKYNEDNFLNGKVIGSFICDKITRYESEFWDDDTYERIQEPWEPPDFSEYGEYEYDTIGINSEFYGAGVELSKQSCLSWNELRSYVGQGIRNFYGWHITEPKLFDEPKEFYELYAPCKKNKQTADENCKGCAYAYKGVTTGKIYCDNVLTRPPQSFCYVEDINEI